MDARTLAAMSEWLGLIEADFSEIVVLWGVAERLEREGWRFYGYDDHYTSFGRKVGDSERFPTKSAAVVAAWKHATGAPDA